jgi:hypothetical protein
MKIRMYTLNLVRLATKINICIDFHTSAMGNLRPFELFSVALLKQPWATQIGSGAKFLLNSDVEGQNTGFLYRFSRFFY